METIILRNMTFTMVILVVRKMFWGIMVSKWSKIAEKRWKSDPGITAACSWEETIKRKKLEK